MSSATNRTNATVRSYVNGKMRTITINKVVGEPTLVTYGILFDQLAMSASLVKTNPWGGGAPWPSATSNKRCKIHRHHRHPHSHHNETGKTGPRRCPPQR